MSDVRIEGNYPVDKISDISMNIRVNEHGTLTYSGLVSKEEAIRYVEQNSDRQLVKVYIKDKLEFCGYPSEISTEWPNADFANNHCHVSIKLVTSTMFADLYPKKRFYQDTTRTFEDVIMEALEDSQIGNLIAIRGEQSIEEPILQYCETDWQFALRMAGRLGTLIVPNVLSEEPEFTLGIPERQETEEPNDFVYQMGRNISEFRAKFNETSKVSQQFRGLQEVSDFHNFLRYKMRSENRYNLGDSVVVDGKTLIVMSKTLGYKRSEIEEFYILGHEQDFSVPFHHNKHITGLELSGTVFERDGQRIKMLLDIDFGREEHEKTWFYYSPVTNNAMYSMPLEGEIVMLQWQSEVDHDALIVCPIRQNGNSLPNHDKRQLSTEHDSRMMMIPDLMMYENPVGSIQWLNGWGFNISTIKGFALMADGDIVINSNAQVEMRSPERITFGKTDTPSSIDMISNNIHIAAEDVVIKSGVNDYIRPRIPIREGNFEISALSASRLAGTFADVNNLSGINDFILTMPSSSGPIDASEISFPAEQYRFASPDEVAMAFAYRYNRYSIHNGREVGAAIVRVDVFATTITQRGWGPFTWNVTNTDWNTIIDSYYTYGTRGGGIGGISHGPIANSRNEYTLSINSSEPPRDTNNIRYTEVAQIHTHGPYSRVAFSARNQSRASTPMMGFSDSDIDTARRRNVDTYVVDSCGSLFRATVAENFRDRETIIATGFYACPLRQHQRGRTLDLRQHPELWPWNPEVRRGPDFCLYEFIDTVIAEVLPPLDSYGHPIAS